MQNSQIQVHITDLKHIKQTNCYNVTINLYSVFHGCHFLRMVSSTKLLTDLNENIWSPMSGKIDEMDPTINVEQSKTRRE